MTGLALEAQSSTAQNGDEFTGRGEVFAGGFPLAEADRLGPMRVGTTNAGDGNREEPRRTSLQNGEHVHEGSRTGALETVESFLPAGGTDLKEQRSSRWAEGSGEASALTDSADRIPSRLDVLRARAAQSERVSVERRSAENGPKYVVWLGTDHYAIRQLEFLREQVGPDAIDTPAYDELANEGVRFTRAYASTPICVPSRTTMMTGTYAHAEEHGLFDNNPQIRREPGQQPLPPDRDYWSDAFTDGGTRAAYFGKWHVGNWKTAQDYGFEGWSQPGYGFPWSDDRYMNYLSARGISDPLLDMSWHLWLNPDNISAFNLTERPRPPGMFGDPRLDPSAGLLSTGTASHEAQFNANIGIDWIEQRVQDNEPFMARIVTWGPHQPYWRTSAFSGQISPSAFPQYPNFDLDPVEAGRPSHHQVHIPNASSWDEWSEVLAATYEHISQIDHAHHKVLKTLDSLGIADETLVVYTSDHGDLVGTNHGSFDKAWLMTEEVARIPLLMRWPNGGIEGGKEIDELVANLDFAPTMWDAAGQTPPSDMHGRSLLDLAANPEGTPWRDQLMLQHYGHYNNRIVQRALYDGSYKYVAHLIYRTNADQPPSELEPTPRFQEELYDLSADPYEEDNLAVGSRAPDVLRQMRQDLAEKIEAVGETNSPYPQAQEDAQFLRQILLNQSTAHPHYGSGTALVLDGSGGFVDLPNDALINTSGGHGTKTVEMWIKPADTTGRQMVYEQGGGSTGMNVYLEGGTLYAGAWNDQESGWGHWITTSEIERGQWHHVALVLDVPDNALRLYLDGQQVGVKEAPGPLAYHGGWVAIGTVNQNTYVPGEGGVWGPDYFEGRVDQFRLWQGALSQSTIRTLSRRTLTTEETRADSLILAYRFDKDGGPVAIDEARILNGTLSGGTAWASFSGAPLGQHSTVVPGGGEATVGPSGGNVAVQNVSASGDDALQVYQYGTPNGPVIESTEPGEDFSAVSGANARLHMVWGLHAIGNAVEAGSVTFDFSGDDGVNDPSEVVLLRRSGPGDAWMDVTGSWTRNGRTFTRNDVSTTGQYAVAGERRNLPVELTGFEGTWTDDGVRVTWTTASETNNAVFRVERIEEETNGQWTQVGSVDGAGTTDGPRRYRFEDTAVPYAADRLTYRLVQVDTDGSTSILGSVAVDRGSVEALQLLGPSPNPAQTRVTLSFAVPEGHQGESVTLRLYDALGRPVKTLIQGAAKPGRHTRQLDVAGLASGTYFLRLKAGSTVKTERLTVVR